MATSNETLVRGDDSSKIIPSDRRCSNAGTQPSRSASFSRLIRSTIAFSSATVKSFVSMKSLAI